MYLLLNHHGTTQIVLAAKICQQCRLNLFYYVILQGCLEVTRNGLPLSLQQVV